MKCAELISIIYRPVPTWMLFDEAILTGIVGHFEDLVDAGTQGAAGFQGDPAESLVQDLLAVGVRTEIEGYPALAGQIVFAFGGLSEQVIEPAFAHADFHFGQGAVGRNWPGFDDRAATLRGRGCRFRSRWLSRLTGRCFLGGSTLCGASCRQRTSQSEEQKFFLNKLAMSFVLVVNGIKWLLLGPYGWSVPEDAVKTSL